MQTIALKRNTVILCTLFVSVVGYGRTIMEIDKEIVVLRNEYTKLQQNPIFIWGSKQNNLSEQQKAATSAYNVNIAQGKERGKYKTKKVVTLNPEYVCPVHKVIYVGDHCPALPGCKSETRIGTSNFCGLGSDYDLSYRTWKLLTAKIPESETQESRLHDIEKEIADKRAEQAELLTQQRQAKLNASAKKASATDEKTTSKSMRATKTTKKTNKSVKPTEEP